MAKSAFTPSEWNKVTALSEASGEEFGLPHRRNKSVVLSTFNIRKLGEIKNRSPQAWKFLQMISQRFDLLAIQEVMDNLEGIRKLKELLGKKYGLVISDVTGVFPSDRGNAERLAFLFHWPRIKRTELASDITYDRSKIVQTLFENHVKFQKAWKEHLPQLEKWEEKVRLAKETGKKKPGKPGIILPTFLTFIRQPHYASFQVLSRNNADPFNFLVVNAHLLYGENEFERKWEFDALIEWLAIRAKKSDSMYYKNILMMGDCNLEFEKAEIKRTEIDSKLKELNKKKLKSKRAAK